MTFEKGYFVNSAISNYRDYTKKKYGQLCEDLISLGIDREETIIDFGCATGKLVHEFYMRGYRNIRGTDISWWAIREGRRLYNFDARILQYLNYGLLENGADWILALDVFEHIGDEELENILDIMNCKYLVVRVPVSAQEGHPYVLDVSRNDQTHVQCHTKTWWTNLLDRKFSFVAPIRKKAIYDSEGVFAGVFQCVQ